MKDNKITLKPIALSVCTILQGITSQNEMELDADRTQNNKTIMEKGRPYPIALNANWSLDIGKNGLENKKIEGPLHI